MPASYIGPSGSRFSVVNMAKVTLSAADDGASESEDMMLDDTMAVPTGGINRRSCES